MQDSCSIVLSYLLFIEVKEEFCNKNILELIMV